MLAQEAAIRKNLAERLPNLPKIDEVTRTPVAGLYEVRFGGTEILYSDATGEHIFVNGALIETKTRTDLTEARLDKLLAIDFDKLPLKDAMVAAPGQRRAQDGGLRRSQLRLLQALRARPRWRSRTSPSTPS